MGSMANITRPAFLRSTDMNELLRWQKHTTDNIGAVNAVQMVEVALTASQTISNNVETAIIWAGVIGSEQLGSAFTWSAAMPTRLTCAYSGVYTVLGSAVFVTNGTGTRATYISLNGERRDSVAVASATLVPTRLQCMSVVNLDVGDYIEQTVLQLSGGVLNITGGGTLANLGLGLGRTHMVIRG